MTTREYLQQCTVRLNYGESQGTGFFVAPGLILTCAHVVEYAESNPINVFWKANNQTYTAKIETLLEYPIDLALLKLEGDIPKHGCVDLDEREPKINQYLYIFGYPKAIPEFLTKSAIAKHRSLTGSGFEQSDRRFPQPTVCCQILS